VVAYAYQAQGSTNDRTLPQSERKVGQR